MMYTDINQLTPYQRRVYIIGNAARRRQNTAFSRCIDRGEYDAASRILERSWTEYTTAEEKALLHIKPREPAQAGDKKSLTKQRKHGIFGMIKRHIRRVYKKIRREMK